MNKSLYVKINLFIALSFFLDARLVHAQTEEEISLDKIYLEGTFNQTIIDKLTSMKDGEHYTILEGNKSIIKYNYETGTAVDTIFAVNRHYDENLRQISDYEFDSNESQLLLVTSRQMIYRHSFSADYYICNLKDNSITPLSPGGSQRLATFSPESNKVGYVFNNNLYYRDLLNNKTVQITKDGKENEIINGAPDWVYEEEFEFTKAFEWSPDGSKIAFYRFDESQVKQFNIVIYDSLYPELFKYKYPKAGEDNSVVSIHVYDVITGLTKTMDIGANSDQYIQGIKWTKDPDKLCITRLNRLQNRMDIIFADASTGKSKIIHTEESKYYVSEITDSHITFVNDKRHFILRSGIDGYMHFYFFDINGNLINQITGGEWDADECLGVDLDNSLLFYSSSEDSPLERHVYSIKLDGTEKNKLTKKTGTNTVVFSRGFKYFINFNSTADSPYYITVHGSSGKLIRVLENNKILSDRIKIYGFIKKEFIKIPVSDNLELNAYLIKPADFDESKQYPLFFYVYGGPGSQRVKNEWESRLAWHQMLVQNGYIVACVDNRGTGARGEEFRKCIYMQLGKLETEDLIKSAEYLAGLPYIDKSRIGIFGGSYGGYLTLLCLTKGAHVFKTGIALSPVTYWRFYNTIYTERYMRKPEDNIKGYEEGSPINYVNKLTSDLLLIHGTADDNVHIQHSMVLIERLIKNNIQFEMQLYPNLKHGIIGGYARYHLYKLITDFIYRNL